MLQHGNMSEMKRSATLILGTVGMLNERLAWAEASDLAGTWHGESLCSSEAGGDPVWRSGKRHPHGDRELQDAEI